MRNAEGILPVDLDGGICLGEKAVGLVEVTGREAVALEGDTLSGSTGNHLPTARRERVTVDIRRRIEGRDLEVGYPTVITIGAVLARVETVRRPKACLLDEGHSKSNSQAHRARLVADKEIRPRNQLGQFKVVAGDGILGMDLGHPSQFLDLVRQPDKEHLRAEGFTDQIPPEVRIVVARAAVTDDPPPCPRRGGNFQPRIRHRVRIDPITLQFHQADPVDQPAITEGREIDAVLVLRRIPVNHLADILLSFE